MLRTTMLGSRKLAAFLAAIAIALLSGQPASVFAKDGFSKVFCLPLAPIWRP
jgi:hypothetical protein